MDFAMYGYVIPSLDVLPQHEQSRFKAAYCGLCHTLAKQNGQHCRMTLSFDLVFLALVLGSLYEHPERGGQMRCPVHPSKKMNFATNKAYSYVADLSVALAYHKLADDWYDDRSKKARTAMFALENSYKAVAARLPEQCASIEQAMADIRKLENMARAAHAGEPAVATNPASATYPADAATSPTSPSQEASAVPSPVSADAAANRFGLLLGSLFAWRDDFWAPALALLGARLGKFVYVMDAAIDLEDDQASGSYNPFVVMGTPPEETRAVLEMLAAAVADAFERLPLERDEHLLRSVIYEGMWARYNEKYGTGEQTKGGAAQ